MTRLETLLQNPIFKHGYDSGLENKKPIPPKEIDGNKLNIRDCFIWGTAYIKGKHNGGKLDSKKRS